MTENPKNPQEEQVKAPSFKLFDSIAALKAELNKINWTTADELKVYTKLVVMATFALGIAIYGMDLFIQGMLNGLNGIVHWLVG